jgi:hypothetical protein
MTEATRIHVTLLAVAFAAVGVSVVAIYVAPTWLAMLVGSRYPRLRRRGQQANSTPHTDAKLPPV